MAKLSVDAVKVQEGLTGTSRMQDRMREASTIVYEVNAAGAWVYLAGKPTFLSTELMVKYLLVSTPQSTLEELAIKGRVGQAGYLREHNYPNMCLQGAVMAEACVKPYGWANQQSLKQLRGLLEGNPTDVTGLAEPVSFVRVMERREGKRLGEALSALGIAWDSRRGRSQVFTRTKQVDATLEGCGEAFEWLDLGFDSWQVRLK